MLEFILILLYCLAFFASPLLFFSAIGRTHSLLSRWVRISMSVSLASGCTYVFSTYPEAKTAGCCGIAVLILTSATLIFTLAGAPQKD